MEAIFTPGMTAPAHTHAGPEAWYTLAGKPAGDSQRYADAVLRVAACGCTGWTADAP